MKPTRRSVETVLHRVDEALTALHRIESRKVTAVSVSLCNAEVRLKRWLREMDGAS